MDLSLNHTKKTQAQTTLCVCVCVKKIGAIQSCLHTETFELETMTIWIGYYGSGS